MSSGFVARHRVRDAEHYWCEVDEYRDGDASYFLCHIRFSRFSPRIFRDFLDAWKIFRASFPHPLFCFAGPDDSEKWHRFVRRIGFTPLPTTILCRNGAERQLFINVRDCPR